MTVASKQHAWRRSGDDRVESISGCQQPAACFSGFWLAFFSFCLLQLLSEGLELFDSSASHVVLLFGCGAAASMAAMSAAGIRGSEASRMCKPVHACAARQIKNSARIEDFKTQGAKNRPQDIMIPVIGTTNRRGPLFFGQLPIG